MLTAVASGAGIETREAQTGNVCIVIGQLVPEVSDKGTPKQGVAGKTRQQCPVGVAKHAVFNKLVSGHT